MEAAIHLDATQYEIENEYYFVDIPKLIEIKAKVKATDVLESLQIAIASNNRGVEQPEFSQLIKSLNSRIGIKEETKFNRDKFEQLRMMTRGG